MTNIPLVPPNPPNPPNRRGYKLTTWLFLALIVVTIGAGLASAWFPNYLCVIWAAIALFMLFFVVALGLDLQQRPLGILISERNLMSLSRFQLAAWTILICSAFVTIGLARVFAHADDPLGITLPAQVWQLLGISATSTVGASLVLKNKTNKEPANKDVLMDKVAEQTGDNSGQTVDDNRKGIAYGNASASDARITDMFEGDELVNTAYIDIAKLQMFFFTLITLIAYAVNIGQWMVDNTPEVFNTFPSLSPGLVALLGISHAAYLV